jgi:alanine racemase
MINLHDLLSAANGQLFGDAAAELFTDFCFDSRRVSAGELFIAIKTERGDGHQYMSDAVQGGAVGILCARPPDFDTNGVTVIVARDVEGALLKWAQIILTRFNTTVIGVSGSVGKSTTKEAIAAVLSTRHNVYKSPGSYNGRFGLPLALGKLTANDRIAVLEYGTDRFGEIAELVEATGPRVGVVTTIGHGHTDRLGTLNNIAAENGVLIERLPSDGLAVLNYDDDLVRAMSIHGPQHILTIGLDRAGPAYGADLMAYNLVTTRDKTGFDLRYQQDRYQGRWVPLLGAHQLYSVLAALAVGLYFEVPIEDGLRALTNLEPLPGRLRPLEGINGSLIIDDTFNANPESAAAALDWLASIRPPDGKSAGRLIGVFGDMDELGAHALPGHMEVGQRAADVLDLLITEGEQGAVIGRAALDHGLRREQVKMTFSHRDAAELLAHTLTADDVALVKAGTAARLERVVHAVLANPDDSHKLPRPEQAYESVWADRPSRPTWLEIDQSAIASNTRLLKDMIGADTELMAVVKANAFGHGAVAVSATALLNGASWLGVASVNEAEGLRTAGIDAPILVLGYTPLWAAPQVIRYDLAIALYDLDLARGFDRAARDMNARINAHVKIDSGMGRLGLLPEQAMSFFRAARSLRNLNIEGIFTHFASAESDPAYTRDQLRVFLDVIEPLRAGGFEFRYIHASNSAGTLNLPEARFNLVRAGIALYGLNPGAALPDGFRPAMTWKTTIAQVKTLPPGSSVGYGNTYRTRDVERIAVIPVGYADGFRRSPKNWGYVLVGGQRAPLVGRVSMDQSTINVTNIPDAAIGSEVVLIGRQGEETLTAEDVAERLGTINYEVVSTILARVPRV